MLSESISPRAMASAASLLPLYPSTIWQSSFSASQMKAAPSDMLSTGPLAAHRHFLPALSASATVFTWKCGPTIQPDGGAVRVAR